MSCSETNESRKVDFYCKNITGYHVRNVVDLHVAERSIVVNVGQNRAIVHGFPVKGVAPQKSTLVENARIVSADSILLIRVEDEENLGRLILQDDWKLASELFGPDLDGVALWRSPQQDIGTVELSPGQVTGDTLTCDDFMTFRVQVNLWFAPGRTDCGIHNHSGSDNDFLEYHPQIVGIGRMQKFREQDKSTLYEEVVLAEGMTHDVFCSTDRESGSFVYPWHQYYSDNDCVWLVVELHPQR